MQKTTQISVFAKFNFKRQLQYQIYYIYTLAKYSLYSVCRLWRSFFLFSSYNPKPRKTSPPRCVRPSPASSGLFGEYSPVRSMPISGQEYFYKCKTHINKHIRTVAILNWVTWRDPTRQLHDTESVSINRYLEFE